MAKTPFASFRSVNRGPLVQKIGQQYKTLDKNQRIPMSHLCIKYLIQRRTKVTTYNNWSYSNARFTLIIKAKVPESRGDIHNYGKHPTPQKINAYIVNKNSTK